LQDQGLRVIEYGDGEELSKYDVGLNHGDKNWIQPEGWEDEDGTWMEPDPDTEQWEQTIYASIESINAEEGEYTVIADELSGKYYIKELSDSFDNMDAARDAIRDDYLTKNNQAVAPSRADAVAQLFDLPDVLFQRGRSSGQAAGQMDMFGMMSDAATETPVVETPKVEATAPATNAPQWKYEDYSAWSRQIAQNYTRKEIEKEIGLADGKRAGLGKSATAAVDRTTSMQSNSQARAQTSNALRGNWERLNAYQNALELYDFYPEKTKEGAPKAEPMVLDEDGGVPDEIAFAPVKTYTAPELDALGIAYRKIGPREIEVSRGGIAVGIYDQQDGTWAASYKPTTSSSAISSAKNPDPNVVIAWAVNQLNEHTNAPEIDAKVKTLAQQMTARINRELAKTGDQPVPEAQYYKYAERLIKAVNGKDAGELTTMLHSGNRASVVAFEQLTGLGAGTTDKTITDAIAQWVGKDAYKRFTDDRAARETARTETLKSKSETNAVEKSGAVKFSDGRTVKQTWDMRIKEGYTILGKHKRGAVDRVTISNPEGSFYELRPFERPYVEWAAGNVDKIAAPETPAAALPDIRDKVLSEVSKRNNRASLADLQAALGYNRSNYGNVPESNPVNAAMLKLRDEGLIEVDSTGWGEPIVKAVTTTEQQRIESGTKRIGDTHRAPVEEEIGAEVDGFTSSMTPAQRQNADDALSVNMLHNGEMLTRRALVDKSVANGYTVVPNAKDRRRLMSPSGSYIEEKRLTKTGMDYAEYLIANKPSASPDAVTPDKPKWQMTYAEYEAAYHPEIEQARRSAGMGAKNVPTKVARAVDEHRTIVRKAMLKGAEIPDAVKRDLPNVFDPNRGAEMAYGEDWLGGDMLDKVTPEEAEALNTAHDQYRVAKDNRPALAAYRDLALAIRARIETPTVNAYDLTLDEFLKYIYRDTRGAVNAQALAGGKDDIGIDTANWLKVVQKALDTGATVKPEVVADFAKQGGRVPEARRFEYAAVLAQPKAKFGKPQQTGLFGAGEDTALFSGTAQTVQPDLFAPQEVAPQSKMFDTRPEFGQTTKKPAATSGALEFGQKAPTGKAKKASGGDGPMLFQKADLNTPEFKKWFGDSKAVDKNGNPVVVYHGTTADFGEFDKDKLGSATPAKTSVLGFFFTDNQNVSNLFNRGDGGRSIPAFLSIKNPLEVGAIDLDDRKHMMIDPFEAIHNAIVKISGKASWDDITNDDAIAWREKIKSIGFDGIIVRYTAMDSRGGGTARSIKNPYHDFYIAFEPTQIKSAIGNRGTFDATDPNILYQTEPEAPDLLRGETRLTVDGEVERLSSTDGTIDTTDHTGETTSAPIDPGVYPTPPQATADSRPVPMPDALNQLWLTKVRGMVDQMKDLMAADAETPAVRGLGGKDVDPATLALLDKYLGQVSGAMGKAKQQSMRWGEIKRDAALLNYSDRRQYNDYLSVLAPYEFFMTRSMAAWAARALDHPSIIANYLRTKRLLETAVTSKGTPTRLQGQARIPTPFLPDWMGDNLYFDPMRIGLPLQSFTDPWTTWGENQAKVDDRAYKTLDQWVADETVSATDADAAIAAKSGALWDKAVAYVKSQDKSLDKDALDLGMSIVSPHLPLKIALDALRGKSEGMSQLPITRYARALSIAAGVGGDSGVNLEEGIRRANGLPILDQWADYRIDRELANMAAEYALKPDGTPVTVDEVQQAMISREGVVYEMATIREAQQSMVKSLPLGQIFKTPIEQVPEGLLTMALVTMFGQGVNVLPEGETRQRSLAEKYKLFKAAYSAEANGDKSPMTAFLADHPEYEARLSLYDNKEERLRSFLAGKVWEKWAVTPRAYKQDLQQAFGQEFTTAFLEKTTRAYDSIPLDTLTRWANTLGVLVPGDPKSNPLPVQWTDPATAKAVEAYYADRQTLFDWPAVSAQLNEYYDIDPTEKVTYQIGVYKSGKKKGQPIYKSVTKKNIYMDQHPELGAYFDWSANFKKDNPGVQAYIDESATLRGPESPYSDSQWAEMGYTIPKELAPIAQAWIFSGRQPNASSKKALTVVWEKNGKPYGALDKWLMMELAVQ
jgi:hypothetical protein